MRQIGCALRLAGVVALLLASLCGCRQHGYASPNASNPAGTTITALIWAPEWTQQMLRIAAEFTKLNPDIRVNVQFMIGDSVEENIKPRIASGNLPDLVSVNPNAYAAELADEGILADVGGTAAWNNMLGSLKEDWTSRSKKFGVSGGVATTPIYYNKEMFAKVGIKKLPTNFREFLQVCEQLKRAGFVPMMLNGGFPNMLGNGPFGSGFANNVVAHEVAWKQKIGDGSLDLNTPEVADIFAKMLLMVDRGYVQKGFMATDYDGGIQLFKEGKVAMAFHGSWAAGLLLHGNPFKVGVFIPPWNAPGRLVVPVIGSETGFAVCETPNKAAAMRFLEFIAGKGFSALQRKRRNIPPFKHAAGTIVTDRIMVDYTNKVSRYPVTSSPYYSLAIGRDLSDRMVFEETIWKQANFDALTQLPNRQMFHCRLEYEARVSDSCRKRVALMLIDLDRFKEVNDSLGHDKGDVLLVEAARRISSCVRESDTVARLGGDEFTVILPRLDDAESIGQVASAIIGKLAEPFDLGSDEAFISASVGVTIYPDDAAELDVLFKNVDQAMYAAKNAGRNRVGYFTRDLRVVAERRVRLTSDLRAAIQGNQFQLYYQPIVELATGEIRKAEALIRWLHPERGMVSPHDFIPLAEETGLIVPIGDWVFRQAVQQARQWRARFGPTFQISVNMSPVQIRQDSLVCVHWSEYLAQEGMPGQSVAVEITEGLLLDAELNEKLLTFRDAGVGVSIDDFGTGYSSLAYLKRFDIDYLKIDRSFVHNLGFDGDNQALCEAMVVLAHKLGLQVIAEGVETAEQRDFLRDVGCDFAQGFLYSQPVPPDAFELLASPDFDDRPDTHRLRTGRQTEHC